MTDIWMAALVGMPFIFMVVFISLWSRGMERHFKNREIEMILDIQDLRRALNGVIKESPPHGTTCHCVICTAMHTLVCTNRWDKK